MEKLFEIIPHHHFATSLKENTLGNIKIAVLREVIGNAIVRSNYPDETITFKLSQNREVLEVPARKMKSREKLLGLRICRNFGVVDKSVRYNTISDKNFLSNPNSVLFGDSVTVSNDSASLPSRVIYDWAYSLRDIGYISETYQHNAVNEFGTMWDEKAGKNSDKLFQVQYVKPGTYLPHFLVVENVTPELFIHLMICVMNQSRYFAQSTTTSPSNVKNHILGIGYSAFEQPVNSYTISANWSEDQEVSFESVSIAINSSMKDHYGENYQSGEELTKLIQSLWQDQERMSKLYKKAAADCDAFLKDIKIIKK
ncbi:MAG: type I-D CRISPR-associated protein Cas7/Csc2 [Bacteroidota bacterium]